ncbi:NUMOD4 domain-containing protein [Devosia sp. A449]
MTEESWKPAVGYPPYYVSSQGRVKRLAYTDEGGRKRPEYHLKPLYMRTDARPYRKSRGPYLSIYKNGQCKRVLLSELVAKTHIDETYDKAVHDLRFRDLDPSNCTVENIVVVPLFAVP